MTNSNSPEPTKKNPLKGKPGSFLSTLFKLFVALFFGLLLVTLIFIWAIATTTGANATLSLFGPYVGIYTQGVSGSFMHQLTIQHIEFNHEELNIVADGVKLQWQPSALLMQHIQLNYLHINNMQLAVEERQDSATPMTLPVSLKLPGLIKQFTADQLAVSHLQLVMLKANQPSKEALQFSALKAHVSIDTTKYQIQFLGTTPWGNAAVSGDFKTTSPFATQAQFDWQGLPIQQDGVTVPVAEVRGTLSGSWEKLLVHARLTAASDVVQANFKSTKKIVSKGKQPIDPASGELHAVLMPFSNLPIQMLQMDLKSINPARFYANAPNANLELNADFKEIGDITSPAIHGEFSIKNTQSGAWNLGGLPFSKLSSGLTIKERQLSWHDAKMELDDGGSIAGSGHLQLPKLDTSSEQISITRLPKMTASVNLKNVNLFRVDNRLKKTQLSGALQADSAKTGLQFALNLKDSQPNLDANLIADVHVNHQYVVDVKKIELRAKDASLTARGSVALKDKQEFLLQGEVLQFNPANWIDVPTGRIAMHFDVNGSLTPGWRVAAKVMELSGQFAGLNLHAEADIVAQENSVLAIKKLELNWGENHLLAQGNWRLGGAEHAQNRAQHKVLNDQLKFSLAIHDLAELSEPFKKILSSAKQETIQGALFVDGILSGSAQSPSGQFTVKADDLAIPDVIELSTLQANVALANGSNGKLEGRLEATGLILGLSSSASSLSNDNNGFRINSVQANLSGVRHLHQLQLTAMLPRKYQIGLQAKGDLKGTGHALQWRGEVQKFDLSGKSDLQLMSPFAVQVASQAVHMGAANWQGSLGKLQVEKIDWEQGQLTTSGKIQELAVVDAFKLGRVNLPLIGNLHVDAGWQLEMGQQAAGQVEVKRTNGDLVIQDTSGGYSQIYALGLQDLSLKARIGAVNWGKSNDGSAKEPVHFFRQPVELQLKAQGNQFGQITGQLHSYVNKTNQGWEVAYNAPLAGTATLRINDIQWLSQFLKADVALRGELQAQAQLAGTLSDPAYSANISGKGLQVSLAELGVLLPNGILEAKVERNSEEDLNNDAKKGATGAEKGKNNTRLKINQLSFSQKIKAPPKHDQLKGLTWLTEVGFVQASGEIDLQSGRGSINAHWQHFPFLQANESWLVASGDAQLTEAKNAWNLTGDLLADAAYFSTPKQAPPKLSSDVVVLKKKDKRSLSRTAKEDDLQSNVDFNIKTGNNFIFVGRGLDTRLLGELRLRIQNDGPVLATGSIQTAGGTYEGYGQQLAIERGILNFQGALDRPSLNVRALRRGLPVEAGVEIVGTVAKPEVRLISEPNVPDQDKLSWMVLGRSSDQAGSDAGLLMNAASAIFGSDGHRSIPAQIAKTFGLDEFSVSTVSTAPGSQLPNQTVAGSIGNFASTEQVFSVGKRLTPDLVFSIERSLTDATNGVKLTWNLTRRFSLVGRTGSDTSIDGQYLFSFD